MTTSAAPAATEKTVMKVLMLAALLFALVSPAAAELATERFIGVSSEEIVIVSPDIPRSGAASFFAEAVWENGTFLARTAVVTWYTSPGADILGYQVYRDLPPSALVVNNGLTRATLTLPDGSVMTWTATGDGSQSESDDLRHTAAGYRSRESRHDVFNTARVVGTLAGVQFDTLNDHAHAVIFRNDYLLKDNNTSQAWKDAAR